MFISFEGIDGSGKSTQAKAFASYLKEQGHDVVLTREPGGSTGAEEIRKLLVSGDTERWSALTELLLFNAARRDHIEKTVLPAQSAGKIVITDRFADSTFVYQGMVRADLKALAIEIHNLAISLYPDLTFLIDCNPEHSLRRGLERGSGEDRFEDFGLEFQNRLRAGFLDLAKSFPKRIKLINGDQEIEAVTHDLIQAYREAKHE